MNNNYNKNNTYLELNDWAKSIFDNFGRIVLLKHYNNYDKINLYKDNIQDLNDRLEIKINKVKNTDIKDDLKDLLYRINVLDDYLDRNF